MTGKIIASLYARFVVLALTIAFGTAQAAEIKVMAANAVKEPFLELVTAFEKTTGHKVNTTWGGTEAIAKRVSGGEVSDVIIIAAPNIDKLIAEGKLATGSRADFAKSGIGVAVRGGLPKPDISSAEALKKAVLEAKSIAYSSGPSGGYVAELLKQMGIADQVRDKVKQPPSGVQVGEILARGEADLGFQQVSELLQVKGIEFLGPLPAAIQHITVYSAALHATAPAPDAAKALVKFLTAPEAKPAITKARLEPG